MSRSATAGVVSEALALYRIHWQHLIPIAAAVYLGLALLTILLASLLPVFGTLIASALSIVGVFWVQGALTRAVQDIRDGTADLSVGETFRSVQDSIVPIAAASIVASIAIAIGLALFIVPGLVLITIWSLIVPAIVLEKSRAFEAFGRSQGLVKGNGLEVFGVVALTFLILVLFGIVVGAILSPLDPSARGLVSNTISGTLTAPFIALAWTLLYYRLRGA